MNRHLLKAAANTGSVEDVVRALESGVALMAVAKCWPCKSEFYDAIHAMVRRTADPQDEDEVIALVSDMMDIKVHENSHVTVLGMYLRELRRNDPGKLETLRCAIELALSSEPDYDHAQGKADGSVDLMQSIRDASRGL